VLRFLFARVLRLVPVVLGVALLVLVLFHGFAPDPVRAALGQHATAQAQAALRQQWGLDQAWDAQYLGLLSQLLTLDFGRSFVTREEVWTLLRDGAGVSLAVTGPPFVAALFVSVGMALVIAYRPGGWVDRFASAVFVGGMCISALVYVLALQYLLAFKLGWFPIAGFERGWAGIRYLLLPWVILLLVSIGPDIRLFRSLLLAETGADHVRTARAKGAGEARVLVQHVLPNAAIPIITHTLASVPFLVLGSLLLERFFSIPGIGDLVASALASGDLPVLKAVTLCGAMVLVLFNLVADALCAWVDPRVRFGAAP
jgi:peptide/nickel transport system permease protein